MIGGSGDSRCGIGRTAASACEAGGIKTASSPPVGDVEDPKSAAFGATCVMASDMDRTVASAGERAGPTFLEG